MTPSSRSVRIAIAAGALLSASAVTMTSLASSALFTASASSGPAAVTSGSVELALSGTSSTTLAVTAMAPGDARYGVVTVTNTGSLQSRYSARATWSTPNALTATLELSTRRIDAVGSACDATLAWGSGDLATDRSAATDETSVALFGSSAPGQQVGDRTIDASTSEILCVRLRLPSAAGNSVAGLTSALTLEFAAEQTANNA
jgi:transcriptional regulator GlxA family with amidase domain